MHYYICSDLSPSSDPFIRNKIPGVVETLSVVIHVALKLRIWKHRKKTNQPPIGNLFHKEHELSFLEKESIADFTSNLIGLLAITIFSLSSIKINSLTEHDINEYPNYLYLFFFQLICPCLLCLTVSSVNYLRHGPLRNTIWREVKDIYVLVN
jgi:hypothetical protein